MGFYFDDVTGANASKKTEEEYTYSRPSLCAAGGALSSLSSRIEKRRRKCAPGLKWKRFVGFAVDGGEPSCRRRARGQVR